MKALWNGVTLAESDDTIVLEGNHYFPLSSIKREFFRESDTQTTCVWKGVASYYDIEVEGKINKGAAWYYSTPSQKAIAILDRIAFWRGVTVVA